jgi:hypothetical protein
MLVAGWLAVFLGSRSQKRAPSRRLDDRRIKLAARPSASARSAIGWSAISAKRSSLAT